MAAWSWSTSADGVVAVDRGDGRGPTDDGPVQGAGVAKQVAAVERWLPHAVRYGSKHGVPPSWILAIITAESVGNPNAETYCCAGLMAIFYSVHHKTREQMLDPEQNLDYGTSLLARSIKAGNDLPAAASVHVGGSERDGKPHPSSSSPWGMVDGAWDASKSGDGSSGYIDRVVRHSNLWVRRIASGIEPAATPSEPPSPQQAGGFKALPPFLLGCLAGAGATIALLPRLASARRFPRRKSGSAALKAGRSGSGGSAAPGRSSSRRAAPGSGSRRKAGSSSR